VEGHIHQLNVHYLFLSFALSRVLCGRVRSIFPQHGHFAPAHFKNSSHSLQRLYPLL
jgi:hypothetical protein